MKVLIIVCAFNEERNLERCLTSLVKATQDLAHLFDVVTVDNESRDATFEIANRFSNQYDNFKSISIEHDFLCVSRNSYKTFPEYNYYAYIDADGYVDENWARELLNVLEKEKPSIVSGPVLEANSIDNLLWEFNYDSVLFGSSYLIGANMVYSHLLLDNVGGFPTIFKSRGDESSLLLKIQILDLKPRHIFAPKVIAYNAFTDSVITYLKTQYSDGGRSSTMSYLGKTKIADALNLLQRSASLLLIVASLLVFPFDVVAGFLMALLSFGPHLFRFRRFYKESFKKLVKFFSLRALIIYILTTIVSKTFFDAGFILSRIKNEHRGHNILETREPKIVA